MSTLKEGDIVIPRKGPWIDEECTVLEVIKEDVLVELPPGNDGEDKLFPLKDIRKK